MSGDDVIRMAREAGFGFEEGWANRVYSADMVEKFAGIVAFAVREASAKACDDRAAAVARQHTVRGSITLTAKFAVGELQDCAAAIRAGGGEA